MVSDSESTCRSGSPPKVNHFYRVTPCRCLPCLVMQLPRSWVILLTERQDVRTTYHITPPAYVAFCWHLWHCINLHIIITIIVVSLDTWSWPYIQIFNQYIHSHILVVSVTICVSEYNVKCTPKSSLMLQKGQHCDFFGKKCILSHFGNNIFLETVHLVSCTLTIIASMSHKV